MVALAAPKILPEYAISLPHGVGGSFVVVPGAERVLRDVSAVVSLWLVVVLVNGLPVISSISVGSVDPPSVVL